MQHWKLDHGWYTKNPGTQEGYSTTASEERINETIEMNASSIIKLHILYIKRPFDRHQVPPSLPWL